MSKKLKKFLNDAEKTESKIAELEEYLRNVRAAQKKEEDNEIVRAIRSTKLGGRDLLALLENIQAGNVTFQTTVNHENKTSEEAEMEDVIAKDKDSLVVVAGFIRSSSSGILVTLDTKNLFIDGCAGTWMATEECVVESQHFFLMQHEVYKEKAPNVIVDASGKLVSTEIRKGLDEDARKKILDYLHKPLMEKPMNQKPSLHQMEHYQKFYENGEYVRALESTTEQNYNMIDGCANNLPKPRIINGRESVLDKLRIRQMAREKQKSSQEQSADMERNRK